MTEGLVLVRVYRRGDDVWRCRAMPRDAGRFGGEDGIAHTPVECRVPGTGQRPGCFSFRKFNAVRADAAENASFGCFTVLLALYGCFLCFVFRAQEAGRSGNLCGDVRLFDVQRVTTVVPIPGRTCAP